MTEDQTKKVSYSIIGTLIFLLAYMIIRDLSLASLAVSYVNPNLSAGPFDLWVIATSILAPVAAAYVFVSSTVGSIVVSLVATILAKVQSVGSVPSTSTTFDPKKFASATKTSQALKTFDDRLQSVEAQIAKWQAEESQ
jgi:hypothetical protein